MDSPIELLEKMHLKVQEMQYTQNAAHNAMQNALMKASSLIADLETYGFTCEAGPLELSTPFIELKKLIG